MARDATLGWLGPGTRVRGAIRGSGSIEVAGRIEGDVEVQGRVVIAETGSIAGRVVVDALEVRGDLKGPASAKRIAVLARGAITGDVRVDELVIEDGGVLAGTIAMGADVDEGETR